MVRFFFFSMGSLIILLLLVGVIFFFSAFIQGATGFGFGLFALVLLGGFLDIREATIVVTLGSLFIAFFVLFRLRGYLRMERVAIPFIVAMMVTVPLGVWILATAGTRALQLLLGFLLLAAAVQRIWPGKRRRRWHRWTLGIPCGVLSGVSAGVFGASGPPAVAFLSTQGFERHRLSALLHLIYAVGSILRIGDLLRRGMMTGELFLLSMGGMVFIVLGALLGLRIFRFLPEIWLHRAISLFLFLFALRYLLGE